MSSYQFIWHPWILIPCTCLASPRFLYEDNLKKLHLQRTCIDSLFKKLSINSSSRKYEYFPTLHSSCYTFYLCSLKSKSKTHNFPLNLRQRQPQNNTWNLLVVQVIHETLSERPHDNSKLSLLFDLLHCILKRRGIYKS